MGFVTFGDENFGSDHKWLTEFCNSIKEFDVLWRVSGMRVNRVTPEHLRMMKEAGCSAVYFGMETGSRKMLEVMEKKVRLEDNYNAITWIVGSGLHTTIQLVLGMPGETTDTVKETAEFVTYAARLSPDFNPLDLSINYAQALPGTPLYEFARKRGMIGQAIEDEEKYLLKISDRDASDESTTLNFTNMPRVVTESWRPLLIVESASGYIAKFSRKSYDEHLIKSHYFSSFSEEPTQAEGATKSAEGANKSIAASGDTGYFNYPKEKVDVRGVTDSTQTGWGPARLNNESLPGLWSLIAMRRWRVVLVCYPMFFYHLRRFPPLMVLAFDVHRNGVRYAAGLAREYSAFQLKRFGRVNRSETAVGHESLRKFVGGDMTMPLADDPAMLPLRQGVDRAAGTNSWID